jgi:hypothetical protein
MRTGPVRVIHRRSSMRCTVAKSQAREPILNAPGGMTRALAPIAQPLSRSTFCPGRSARLTSASSTILGRAYHMIRCSHDYLRQSYLAAMYSRSTTRRPEACSAFLMAGRESVNSPDRPATLLQSCRHRRWLPGGCSAMPHLARFCTPRTQNPQKIESF